MTVHEAYLKMQERNREARDAWESFLEQSKKWLQDKLSELSSGPQWFNGSADVPAGYYKKEKFMMLQGKAFPGWGKAKDPNGQGG